MQYKHINIPLELSQQTTKELKEQFANVVQAFEIKQSVRFNEIKPLCELLTQVILEQPAFMDVLSSQLKTYDFFAIHLQHHDPELLNLPWCMAKDPVSGKRIEDISNIYLISNLLNDQRIAFPDTSIDLTPLPLRILVMISSPIDMSYKHRLDYEQEEMSILHAFEPLLQSGAVEIHFTNNGSLEELKRKVDHNKYHLLHFSGHGIFQDGKGYLVLEDDFTLKTEFVSGTNIAKALIRDDGYSIPLILLSAAQSAAGSIEKGFHNVTLDLLEHGFPMIIALSMSMMDNHVTQFSQAFYGQLKQEKSILYAFHEAIRHVKKFELQIMKQRYGTNAASISPFQYTIPKLYARTTDFRLFNAQTKLEKSRLESCAYIFKQSKFHQKIPEFVFIGRRQEKAELLSPLFNHKAVLIKGIGGVGKTALAIHLAQRYLVQHPHAIPFFFNEECQSAYSILMALKKALMKKFRENVTADLEVFDTSTEKIMYLIERFIELGSRPLFIFDNLESFQQDIGGTFKPMYSDIAETIVAICEEQQVPVLLTSRYPLPDIKPIACITDLNQIQLTDFWKKCLQLDMADMRYDIQKKLDLSESLPSGKLNFYEIVQVLHTAFGGNYRALEFFNETYKKEKENIYQTISELRQLAEQYKQETLIKMSENLVFSQLLNRLSQEQKEILYLLSHFNVPIQFVALTMQMSLLKQSHINQKQPVSMNQNFYKDLKTLHSTTLIEMYQSQENKRIYLYVTPIVKGLLSVHFSESVLKNSIMNIAFSHQMAGQYFYSLYHNQNFDKLSIFSEAFDHFFLAEDKEKLNETGKELANYYYKYSYYQKVLAYCKKVEQICGNATDRWFYNQLGLIYDIFGKYNTALDYYEKNLVNYQENDDRKSEGATLNNISQIHYARGDYDTALRYLEQSLEIKREIGDQKGEGTTLNNISQIHHTRGDYETALRYLEQSLEIIRETGDRQGEGTTLSNISQTYKARGDYETALRYLEQSLEIMREIGDQKGEGTTLNNISQIHHARGDYDIALRYLEQSLEIRREIGDRKGESTTLNNLCAIYNARGDYDIALRYLEQSLEIRREIGDRKGEGIILNNIYTIYHAQGEYETALRYLEESLEIMREIVDRKGKGATLNNISQVHDARGDYETALRYLEQSLEIKREIDDRSGMCVTLFNMAHIYFQKKEHQKAIKHWVQTYRIAKEIGFAQVLSALENRTQSLGAKDLSFWDIKADMLNNLES